MTDFGYLPEARDIGRPASEFRLALDTLAEAMPAVAVDLGGNTTFVFTNNHLLMDGDMPVILPRRVLVTFVPLDDGRLSIEVRGYVDDDMVDLDVHEAGNARLVVF